MVSKDPIGTSKCNGTNFMAPIQSDTFKNELTQSNQAFSFTYEEGKTAFYDVLIIIINFKAHAVQLEWSM